MTPGIPFILSFFTLFIELGVNYVGSFGQTATLASNPRPSLPRLPSASSTKQTIHSKPPPTEYNNNTGTTTASCPPHHGPSLSKRWAIEVSSSPRQQRLMHRPLTLRRPLLPVVSTMLLTPHHSQRSLTPTLRYQRHHKRQRHPATTRDRRLYSPLRSTRTIR